MMEGRSRPLSIIIASDWAPIRALEPAIRRDPATIYGDTLPVLRAADLRIVNCECALTAARKPVWKSGAVFKGGPAHVSGLTVVPFEVACLANNHVFDYGLAGFQETLGVLHRSAIRTVGAGLNLEEALAPLTVSIKGTRVTILNFSEGEDLTASRGGPGVCGWEIDRLVALVRKAKKRGDFVIVVGHAGLEYIPFPPPYVVEAYRALSDAGADGVVGHHPHVPQGIEVRGGRLIAYSLGNFVFWQESDLYYRKTGFFLRLERDMAVGVLRRPFPTGSMKRVCAGWNVRKTRCFERRSILSPRPSAPLPGVVEAWQAYIAYYGPEGFKKEVLGILERMDSEPRKGAAMFRNRITALQHSELWRDALTRFMTDKTAAVRPGLSRLVEEWFTKTTPSRSV